MLCSSRSLIPSFPIGGLSPSVSCSSSTVAFRSSSKFFAASKNNRFASTVQRLRYPIHFSGVLGSPCKSPEISIVTCSAPLVHCNSIRNFAKERKSAAREPQKMVDTAFSIKTVGQPDTPEFLTYIYRGGNPISCYHDVPMWIDRVKALLNMVVEIPRDTNAKLEINKDEYLNPIKQDVKNGKLRYVAWKYPFNYGALPQTWENPNLVHPDTQCKGDNDPLDVIELSTQPGKIGEVKHIRVLGCYALIDEDETDWKIIAIDVNDPNASKLNDIGDVEKVFPGRLKEIHDWMRDYKTPDGKPPNKFAFDGEVKDRAFAMKVVEECWYEWRSLITGKCDTKTSRVNTTIADSPFRVPVQDAATKLNPQ